MIEEVIDPEAEIKEMRDSAAGMTANQLVDQVESLLTMYQGLTETGKLYWKGDMFRYALLVEANRPPGIAFEVVLDQVRQMANERFRSLQVNCPHFFKSIARIYVKPAPNFTPANRPVFMPSLRT